MPPQIEMPMNTANQHAAAAEEYASQGLIVLAAEEHHKASEALLVAIERSHDESAKRTLQRLLMKHRKDRDDLNRRIEKLKAEGKDPNLPQKSDQSAVPHSRAQVPGALNSLSHAPPSMQVHPPPMTDSQNTVDESFMVLGGQRSDPGDAFNQFWNAMQGMLDNLSQPVAFATAPLGPEPSGSATPPRQQDSSLSSDTDNDEHMLSKWTRKIGIRGEKTKSKKVESISSSFHDDDYDDFLEGGDDLSGSFCLVPADMSPAALKKENTQLKAELAAAKERLAATETMLRLRKEQDMQLRNSIFEAQRAINASGILPPRMTIPGDINFLKQVSMPVPTLNPGREAQYSRRISELEAELRTVKAENEKNKLMITKFRERWEKLKESAKRKKEAKAAAEAGHGVKERIVEEPEAEEELDGTGG